MLYQGTSSLSSTHVASGRIARILQNPASNAWTRFLVGALIVCGLLVPMHAVFSPQGLILIQHILPTSQGSKTRPIDLGRRLFADLQSTSPGISLLTHNVIAQATVFWRTNDDSPRPDILALTPDDLRSLREAHEDYRARITRISLPYQRGTRGIVFTINRQDLSYFIVSLRMLRRTGCKLPVEVVLEARFERSSHLCENLLPQFDTRCVFLEDYISNKTDLLHKYQFKIFSILFSSFEDVLFLDADNCLVEDPEPLFVGELFASHGMITWPDFWASTASPHFYEIQNRSVPKIDTIPSTESGQLLVSKQSHAKALLMAAYYNFYGPDYYYPLLSQGAFGEGDKETYVAGAEAVSASFYQTKKCVDTVGYYEEDRYHGVAMVQYNPMYDVDANTADDKAQQAKPRPLAVHHNSPKLDAAKLFGLKGEAVNHATGQYHRLLGHKNITMERFGRDVETEIWEEIHYVACDLDHDLVQENALLDGKSMCDRVIEYQSNLST